MHRRGIFAHVVCACASIDDKSNENYCKKSKVHNVTKLYQDFTNSVIQYTNQSDCTPILTRKNRTIEEPAKILRALFCNVVLI